MSIRARRKRRANRESTDLKLLSDHRDQVVPARTRLINRTHTDLVISHPGYGKIRKLNTNEN